MKKKRYDAKKFARYLKELIKARGLTMRRASLRAGLDHGAAGRFIRGRRPHRDSCLLLAEALQTDPNEMLAMAGYEAMPVVDRSLIDPGEFPPDVKEFAMALLAMSPERRREVFAPFWITPGPMLWPGCNGQPRQRGNSPPVPRCLRTRSDRPCGRPSARRSSMP